MLDNAIELYLKQVVAVCPEIKAIWLFGSRANGTATSSSDWDFLAFGDDATYERLHLATELHRENVDFMVMTNEDDFQNVWGSLEKIGSLTVWEWSKTSDLSGQYMQTKKKPGSDFDSICTIKKAIRVWPPAIFGSNLNDSYWAP